MSHYVVLVLLNDRCSKGCKSVESLIEKAMMPFCENNGGDKWDWYAIGGRWTGMLDPKYDPTKDPRNIETCQYCHGTGKRTDTVGAEEAAWMKKCGGCNGCHGTGKVVKFSLIPFDGDVKSVKDVLKLKDDVIPLSIITPDGEWYEQGEMGWFACMSNNKGKEKWRKEAKGLLKKFKDCTAVVVDCHI